MEQLSQNIIEEEIADLTKRIEEKRKVLESEKGVLQEREIIKEAIANKISEKVPGYTPSPAPTTSANDIPAIAVGGISYLDRVDEETKTEVNRLLGMVFSQGINTATQEAIKSGPFVLDVFHDALTDKMYEQLKSQGIVK